MGYLIISQYGILSVCVGCIRAIVAAVAVVLLLFKARNVAYFGYEPLTNTVTTTQIFR